MLVHVLGRQGPVGDRSLRPVDIAQHRIEQGRPLHYGPLDDRPVGLVDHEWHDVQRPLPGCVRSSIPTGVKRHAMLPQHPAAILDAPREFVLAGLAQPLEQDRPVGPDIAGGGHHLIVVPLQQAVVLIDTGHRDTG